MPYQRSSRSTSAPPVVVVRRRSPRSPEKTSQSEVSTTSKKALPPQAPTTSAPRGPVPTNKTPAHPVPREEALALLAILCEQWPQTFPTQSPTVHPLALNIDEEIAACLEGWSAKQARRAIAFWKRPRTVAYLRALAAGGPRYSLAGTPQGTVSPEEQQRAAQQLTARSARRQAKKQALKEP